MKTCVLSSGESWGVHCRRNFFFRGNIKPRTFSTGLPKYVRGRRSLIKLPFKVGNTVDQFKTGYYSTSCSKNPASLFMFNIFNSYGGIIRFSRKSRENGRAGGKGPVNVPHLAIPLARVVARRGGAGPIRGMKGEACTGGIRAHIDRMRFCEVVPDVRRRQRYNGVKILNRLGVRGISPAVRISTIPRGQHVARAHVTRDVHPTFRQISICARPNVNITS